MKLELDSLDQRAAKAFDGYLVRKDLGLAIELAEQFGVPLQLGPLAYQEYDDMSKSGRGNLDTSSVALLQEERAGVEIRADVEPH